MFSMLTLFFVLFFGSADSAGFTTPTGRISDPKPITIAPKNDQTKGVRDFDRLPPQPQK